MTATPTPGYSSPRQQTGHKFGALAWTALILGIVGVVGSPIIFLNNLTAVIAAVGVVLGGIALFGTRKVLAGTGVVVSVLAIVFTVLAQDSAGAKFDREFGGGPEIMSDVTVSGCEVVDNYGPTVQAVVTIRNSAAEPQTYMATISVNDPAGNRIGDIHVTASALAPGQSATLSGMDASGTASEAATLGPAGCTVASVDRFPS